MSMATYPRPPPLNPGYNLAGVDAELQRRIASPPRAGREASTQDYPPPHGPPWVENRLLSIPQPLARGVQATERASALRRSNPEKYGGEQPGRP